MPEEEKKGIFGDPDPYKGKKVEAQPVPGPNIGIDTDNQIYDTLKDAVQKGIVDMSSISGFLQVSQSRDQIYSLLDTMCEDITIAAVLETYAEDATERNDNGRIVWVDSSDGDCAAYIQFLLDSMRVDKHVYRWVHSLCKYGDVYLRLYRKSEDDLSDQEERKHHRLNEGVDSKDKLNEDIRLRAYRPSDHYSGYVEMVDNPATVFELTQRGRTKAYVRTSINPSAITSTGSASNAASPFYRYKFNKNDITIYGPADYVHGALEDNTSRTPEEVDLFLNDEDYNSDTNAVSYRVNRGQSLLYNVFKIWRELTLLENSVLLNRLTKSAITRIIGVEVGDMPKENIGPHLQRLKMLIEQREALNANKSLNEYTDPGPIENNLYVPTKGGVGAISTQTIGGDVNVGDLVDLSYFQDKLFSGLKVPKQFFGVTDDSAGFNGGTSLSIISSRYAKTVKRIQNTICQMLTDAINLMLADRDQDGYIGKFSIHMLPPTTQEDIDRRDNTSSKISIVGDVMNQISEIEDTEIKLKILKSLLSNAINNTEIIDLLQEAIDKLTASGEENPEEAGDEEATGGSAGEADDSGYGAEESSADFIGDTFGAEGGEEAAPEESGGEEIGGDEESTLPSPEELNIGDVSDANNPEI